MFSCFHYITLQEAQEPFEADQLHSLLTDQKITKQWHTSQPRRTEMPGMGSTKQSVEIAIGDIHIYIKETDHLSQKPMEWEELQNGAGSLNFIIARVGLPREL
jgi:hypothetical protein